MPQQPHGGFTVAGDPTPGQARARHTQSLVQHHVEPAEGIPAYGSSSRDNLFLS
jgi:hypothetical protein